MKATTHSTAARKPVSTTGWDGTLKFAAAAAWILSLVALVSTADAADATDAVVKTAVVPPSERGVRQPVPVATQFDLTDRYDARPFNWTAPGGSQCKDGTCPIPSTRPAARPVQTNRPNYDGIFDVDFGGDDYAGDWNATPAAPVSDPYSTPAPGYSNAPTAMEKIDGRYADPLNVRLGRGSLGTAISLYTEAADLIDTRHVSPLSYEERTAKALEGVALSLESPGFRRAAGMTATRNQVAPVQRQLRSLAQRPARDSREAIGQMQQAASLVSRSLNVPEGMVAMEFLHSTIDSLDRFSAIVPRQTAMSDVPSKMQTVNVDGRTAGLEENITGVGVEMKVDPRGAIVLGTVDGGPASDAGVRKGDVITAVDSRDVSGMSLNEIATLVGGRSGTSVRFTLDRDGRTGTLAMTRRAIYVSSVANVQMIDAQNKVGYARLKQFSANSAKDLEKAMWKLHRQGMQSFVLDLRGNPGGLLTSAIEISNLYLPCGSIVSTRGRNADDNTQETADYSKTWKTPLVVLIDDGSASASEILAAAIQDNERGVVVGRRSYGKGTVQTHFPLRTVSGNFKLTTAKFYSPSGREMAGAGVAPDVPVAGETDWAASATRDRDVIAAMDVLGDGRPQSLAAAAARCRVQNTARPTYPTR